ncbi:hypothetical protein [Blastopirellula marina]|uniref:Uncharacterized protein n=1 Tax=Blastopirellula marina TaxID=124 RepID=A0A2S8GEP9_9BACT|nr:hypothetical protein [Blastopirellula marina]PQO42893.1 hypothetical protein C5Y93_24525 [Blastopirellula marina]
MSEQDQPLPAPESPRLPGGGVAFAIVAIVLASLKLLWTFSSVPGLIFFWVAKSNFDGLRSGPGDVADIVMKEQAKYVVAQLILLPLSAIVCGMLIWAAVLVLQRRKSGDLWIRRSVIVAGMIDVLATAAVVHLQFGISRGMAGLSQITVEDEVISLGFDDALQLAFYVSVAYSLGLLLLLLGYYVFTFRYFSKPEIRALY